MTYAGSTNQFTFIKKGEFYNSECKYHLIVV